MFKTGTKYDLSICEPDSEKRPSEAIYPLWTAVDVAMPVVKFSRDGKEWILNVSSPLFFGAKPSKSN